MFYKSVPTHLKTRWTTESGSYSLVAPMFHLNVCTDVHIKERISYAQNFRSASPIHNYVHILGQFLVQVKFDNDAKTLSFELVIIGFHLRVAIIHQQV